MSFTDFLFSFEGRIGRGAFWLKFILPMVVLSVIVGVVESLLGTGMILGSIFNLAILWPSLAVYAKRWHDRDKSGWWTLILLTGIGAIWMLVDCGFLKGTAGPNRFGADPVPADGLDPAMEPQV